MIFEVFSSLKGSVICKDELQRLISLDGHLEKWGHILRTFLVAPAQQLAHTACVFLLCWNNTEKISICLLQLCSPPKMSNNPSLPDFVQPQERERSSSLSSSSG